jgi:spermidine synthase
VKTARILDRVKGEGQSWVALSEHHGFLTVSIDDRVLMSSAAHGSEETMALRALGGRGALGSRSGKRRKPLRALIGGLGLGYTLRAALDLCGDRDVIEVAELLPAIIRWHEEGPLGELTNRPLTDPRVQLRRSDVLDVLAAEEGVYDAILLDVDNGPTALVSKANGRLYDAAGAAICARALAPGGTLVVWSARPDEGYVQRLRAAGLRANTETTGAAHASDPGLRHWLFVAERG